MIKLLQSLPKESPPLVEPKSDKVDLPRLKVDSLKYSAAGMFSNNEAAAQWWSNLTQSFELIYRSLPCSHPQWLMDLLTPAEQTGIQEVIINDKILQLHNADMEPQPEVIFHVHI